MRAEIVFPLASNLWPVPGGWRGVRAARYPLVTFAAATGAIVSVHSLDGDWSIFRREIVFGAKNVGRKHGPVPFRGARGTVPFSRRERQFSCDVLSAAKIGTVPCERFPAA